MLDQLVTTFSGLKQARIIFFQIIQQTCEFYKMTRCGAVYVEIRIGRIIMAYTLDDVHKEFEDDCNTWISVCRVFDSLLASLAAARLRADGEPGPPVFLGLATPRSRHIKKDTRHLC